ncbi:MFS transporter [Paractinoplanes rishiriensis]|uniref:MFS transporter n=1 Tax=Paractinoplanes rishiriensis TaxID=1050105 RepID=A0A919K601_9ACTN|nr:MFS transporter [Actinoplanes rishiriensis]GIE99432.1 MFS transporter [Actinoplanes rishiriensis]
MAVPYVDLLRRRHVRGPLLAVLVARFPLAMTPLGAIVLIAEVHDSYASAGVVAGTFALFTAASAPVWGRLMDRIGQPLVIAGTSVFAALMLAVFALVAVAGAPVGLLIALAAAVGLSCPPVNPAMRVAWSVILPDEPARRAAYALDASLVETIFVLGPLLLTVLLAGPAALPLLVTAGLMLAGGVGYARTYAARTWRPVPPAADSSRGGTPLRAPGTMLTLVVGLAMAVAFGHFDVAMTATAERVFNSEAVLGLFFAAAAIGSTAGGLGYGARQWRSQERHQLPVALAGFAAGSALLAAVLVVLPSAPLPLLVVILLATGLCIAPSLIVQQSLIDRHTAPDRRSEAQAWLTTGLTAGSAAGMSIAGVLVDRASPAAAFAGGSAALVGAVLVAVVAQRWWREPDVAEHPAEEPAGQAI